MNFIKTGCDIVYLEDHVENSNNRESQIAIEYN